MQIFNLMLYSKLSLARHEQVERPRPFAPRLRLLRSSESSGDSQHTHHHRASPGRVLGFSSHPPRPFSSSIVFHIIHEIGLGLNALARIGAYIIDLSLPNEAYRRQYPNPAVLYDVLVCVCGSLIPVLKYRSHFLQA